MYRDHCGEALVCDRESVSLDAVVSKRDMSEQIISLAQGADTYSVE